MFKIFFKCVKIFGKSQLQLCLLTWHFIFFSFRKKKIKSAPLDIDLEKEIERLEKLKRLETFTLSANGQAKERWPGYLCDYTITNKKYCDRPVYSNGERFLYSLERESGHQGGRVSGAWGVSDHVGGSEEFMRSTTAASSPDLCPHWEYRDDYDSYKYKPGEISVVVKK